MVNRRTFISGMTIASAGLFSFKGIKEVRGENHSRFRYCLNTSTIRGQSPGLKGYIEIASKAGYDGVELWVRDVRDYVSKGNSLLSIKRMVEDHNLSIEGAIGFAPWLKSSEGMSQMKADMEMMASIETKRIAAPASGYVKGEKLDFRRAGETFYDLLESGIETGIQPCLEFWGSSPVLSNIAQTLMIASYANHPNVKILADVYHMFRGGSGFETLKMINGNILELFHLNDYLNKIPRDHQEDKDRVYPGDGDAPLKQILSDLKHMGGEKVLSLELFNPDYWEQDALQVAKTGLQKMKRIVNEIEK